MSDLVGNPEDQFSQNEAHFEQHCKITCLPVLNQVQHKPGCTEKEDDKRLEILDFGIRGIALSM